ncbi:MAG: C1 family peptidase [Dysgonamonadaceae bacterium]|jgi:aminopeptidase C|nr:C1 family peptidase [Dysgonamonadaceae bacterium]
MKRIFILLLAGCFSLSTFAQETEIKQDNPEKGFRFTTIKELPVTPVKNQASSGTCWSFSTMALIEAELLRQGKGEHDLSEMFVVHKNYEEKAMKYVRMHGEINFSAGGSFADVLNCIRDYGIVPDEIQPGLNYGETQHKHSEIDKLLKAYVDAIVSNPNKKLSPVWMDGFRAILDTYLNPCPAAFSYGGEEYTPQSFARSLGIRPDDYVSLTSFTHHPFYTFFPLEIPDNWRWSYSANIPLDELLQVIDRSIENGYTVAWGADVSEKGFSRKGIAIVPDMDATELPGSDMAHWLGLTQKEKEDFIANPSAPIPEKKITQESRQSGFDNYETTDDHGMLIYGTAQDQNGTKYYLVKNSWGTDSPYQGAWYISLPYVQSKTINIVVHKDVLSKDLKKKLKIEN